MSRGYLKTGNPLPINLQPTLYLPISQPALFAPNGNLLQSLPLFS